jgi:ubiquinone biosynthesis protein
MRATMHIGSRLVRINLALWGHVLWWAAVRSGVRRPDVPPARRLALVLEGLGTTFVKLGQGLSLHRELLSDEYVAQLQRLQDHVEPFDAAVARAEVERSFGPLEQVFASFEPEPFAAGSIAQVHRATMPDGREVVVKVRRPGIRRQVEQDIRILRWFVRTLLWVLPGARRVRPFELIDELARNLQKEIDFRQEAMNNQRFCEIFRDAPDITVPAVVDDLYTDWVMVQEMSHGLRIDNPAFAPQGPRLAHVLVEAYLRQFFREGVFHGDPHPGNLFVLADGRICLHDFGLVGFLDRGTRLNLVAFMMAFAQQDADWLLDAFLDLGMLAGRIDRRELRLGLEEIVQDYARKPLRDWSFGEAFLRVMRIGRGQHIRVPHHLLVLMRAVFLMEHTVRRLDPGFNLAEGLFARAGAVLKESEAATPGPPVDRLAFESMLMARQAPRSLGRLLHEARELAQSWEFRRERIRDPSGDGARRLAAALCALGLYVASAWLFVQSAGPSLLGLPVLPALGAAVALRLTWTCVRKEEE